MRRFFIVATVTALVTLVSIPSHAAVNVALAVPGSFAAGYATPRLVLHKAAATSATFVNLDVEDHDIRSVAKRPNDPTKPLFSSAVIQTGETSPINNLINTPPGEYEFFCIVHTDMRGVATVMA